MLECMLCWATCFIYFNGLFKNLQKMWGCKSTDVKNVTHSQPKTYLKVKKCPHLIVLKYLKVNTF